MITDIDEILEFLGHIQPKIGSAAFNEIYKVAENLKEKIKQGQALNIQNVSTRLDFKQLRDAYFKEHVSNKTTDGIPMVCTHPHNLFEWFKAKLK